MKQKTIEKTKEPEPAFVPNPEYIDLIQKNSRLSRVDPQGIALKVIRERLLEIEKKMSARDIVQNVKLAHPVKDNEQKK